MKPTDKFGKISGRNDEGSSQKEDDSQEQVPGKSPQECSEVIISKIQSLLKWAFESSNTPTKISEN